MTWDRRLYFPSEGRLAEDFFALKNPTASAGFEPANLGTKGQHATSRPPKPLAFLCWSCRIVWMRQNIDHCMVVCSQPLPEPRHSKAAEVTKDVVIITREKQQQQQEQQQQQQQAMRQVSKSWHCCQTTEDHNRRSARIPLNQFCLSNRRFIASHSWWRNEWCLMRISVGHTL